MKKRSQFGHTYAEDPHLDLSQGLKFYKYGPDKC